MAFRNPAIAGQYLVRPALQSPNYVAGSSGWTVNRDGSAEFNSAVIRGSVSIGNPAGQHAILANPATGDPLDVYDSGNNLVYAITNQGAAESINPSNGRRATIFDGAVQLLGANGYVDLFYSEPSPFLTSSQPELIIEVFGGGTSYSLFLMAASSDGTQLPTLVGSEQNIQGSIMQSDRQGSGNLVHTGIYTGTVSGTSGMATFSHNCAFTPTGGVVAPLTHFSQWNWNDSFGVHGFTAGQAQITMFQPVGTPVGNGVAATFAGLFWK